MGTTIDLGKGTHIVRAVNQSGRHSEKPPLAVIEAAVKRHLELLDPLPEASVEYLLRVGAKVDKKPSFEVKFVSILPHNVKGLAVRVRDDQGYWICELICPSDKQAIDLFVTANPDCAVYLASAGMDLLIQDTIADTAPHDIATAIRNDDSGFRREVNSARKTLFSRSVLGAFCLSVFPEGSERIEIDALAHCVVKHSCLIRPSGEIIRALIDLLVQDGFLAPKLDKTKVEYFIPTMLFLEARDGYTERARREESEGLERSLASRRKLLEANRRDRNRAQERVDAFDKAIATLETEVTDLEKQLGRMPKE